MQNLIVTSPLNDKIIAELDYMGYEETTLAIDQAEMAFKSWKEVPVSKRSAILESWYNLVELNKKEIASILNEEQGKPFEEAVKEIEYANSFIKFYSQEILRVFGESSPHFRDNRWFINVYEPIGVVGAITPWNFPCAMITKKIAPALAAGCSVILKPSEETPMTAIKLRELALQAGVPKEVFGIVYGDYKEIGRALLESKKIKMISFTGSVGVGKNLMKHAASTVKKVVLELGGNAPCIVFKEADLELSVEKIIQGKFRNAGQACTAPNRIFVEDSILAAFKALLIKKLSQNNIYNIGPLINQKAKEKTNSLINSAIDSGAKILYSQDNIEKQVSRLYFSPLVIGDLKDDMDIVKEEVFAPVFSILSFKNIQEVIDRSNNTQYGLAAYIFSSDLKKALYVAQKLNFGVFGINETSTAADLTIHGGFNESGLGREGGKAGLMEYLENKFIVF